MEGENGWINGDDRVAGRAGWTAPSALISLVVSGLSNAGAARAGAPLF